MTRPFRDDHELGRLLRAGDPAGDGRDPDRNELQSWRRRILNAAGGDHGVLSRRTRLLSLMAATAAVVLAAMFFLLSERPTPTSQAPQIAVTPPPARPRPNRKRGCRQPYLNPPLLSPSSHPCSWPHLLLLRPLQQKSMPHCNLIVSQRWLRHQAPRSFRRRHREPSSSRRRAGRA